MEKEVNDMLKFSVIVPCYNAEGPIRTCLNSILAQTYENFEVIVINDGSTDNSKAILDEYEEKDSRVHAYHFENSGVAITRTRGTTLAQGDYVIFVDSDDTINPKLLEALGNTIITNKNPDIVRYQVNLVGDDESKDHQRYNWLEEAGTMLSGMDALMLWSKPGKKYAVYWLFAFKREIFFKFQIAASNLRCYEDVALIPILIASSQSVICIDYIGYNYICNNSTSLTNIASMEAERERAIAFWYACDYAITNFVKLDNISGRDIAFFTQDYMRRLKKKYDSLPESLKKEFKPLYQI